MRPEELRIGNYVDGFGDILTVFEVRHDVFLTKDEESGDVEEWLYGPNMDIYPVVLTEDWLEKFGLFSDGCIKHSLSWVNYYDFGGYCIYYNNNEFQITIYTSDGENSGMEFIKRISYVHEFQNIYFALIGEELTIKE